MSGSLTALATTWAGLSGTTVAKLATINAMTVAGPLQDVSVGTILQYLVSHGRIAGLNSFVNATPSNPVPAALLAASYLQAILAGADGSTVRFASQTGLLAILNHLTDDARIGITAGDITALNNAASTPAAPWWQSNGFSGPIQVSDLINAGDLF